MIIICWMMFFLILILCFVRCELVSRAFLRALKKVTDRLYKEIDDNDGIPNELINNCYDLINTNDYNSLLCKLWVWRFDKAIDIENRLDQLINKKNRLKLIQGEK